LQRPDRPRNNPAVQTGDKKIHTFFSGYSDCKKNEKINNPDEKSTMKFLKDFFLLIKTKFLHSIGNSSNK
jgi:hypothetical protein